MQLLNCHDNVFNNVKAVIEIRCCITLISIKAIRMIEMSNYIFIIRGENKSFRLRCYAKHESELLLGTHRSARKY